MKRLILTVPLAVATAGCASAPERKPPDVSVDVPASWTFEEPAQEPIETDTTRWWSYFGSAPLDTLVEEALGGNYDLKGALARVDAAAAVAKRAGADLYPQAAVRADGARRRQNLIGIPIPGSGGVITTRSNSFGVSMDILWELDLWGRIRSGQSAALADLQATWAELAGARLSIAAQVVKAWFAVIESRLQLELAAETVETFQLSADQVERRYQEGVRTSLDLRLALSNLYGAEALLEFRKQQLDVSKRQLEILLGRYPGATLTAASDLPSIVAEVPAGLPSELLIRRPDLLAAERRYAAAEKRVSEARRAFFPRISLTASGGTLSEQLGDLVDGDFGVWSIAANITQPIFQGGRLRANLAQSHAVSDQTLAQYAVALLTAFGEVEATLYAEQTLAKQERHTADAAEQSEAARQLAERQYNAGLIDYITVLETQRRSLNSQSELILVRRQRLDARVNLHVALGGGFDLNEEWTRFLEVRSATEQDHETGETEAPVE
jgi:NodT family efflux transporter outer membrane factor (OMF) lipoprotein